MTTFFKEEMKEGKSESFSGQKTEMHLHCKPETDHLWFWKNVKKHWYWRRAKGFRKLPDSQLKKKDNYDYGKNWVNRSCIILPEIILNQSQNPLKVQVKN